MRGFHHIPNLPDDNPFILDEKEQQGLIVFDAQLSEIQRKKVLYLREIAKRKGLTAPTLEELKSKNGEPFVEVKSTRTSGRDYREAAAKKEIKFPGIKSKRFELEEQAYLCHDMFSKKDTDSCGWVRGAPVEREYDNIGFLSGSAGVRFYCKICGKMIGEHKTVMS